MNDNTCGITATEIQERMSEAYNRLVSTHVDNLMFKSLYGEPEMKLKDHAMTLRSVAQSLEARANCVPAMPPKEFIRQHAGETKFTAQTSLPLYALGDSDFHARDYMVREAARHLAGLLVKPLDFELMYDKGSSGVYGPGSDTVRTYRASIYAFTPAQLEVLVAKAIEAGRQSA